MPGFHKYLSLSSLLLSLLSSSLSSSIIYGGGIFMVYLNIHDENIPISPIAVNIILRGIEVVFENTGRKGINRLEPLPTDTIPQ